tara:strand:+ start:2565 stop:3269 length:705 start_codon:yes stop_codon:yes gene_type:complete
MSNVDKILQNVNIGELNTISRERFGIKKSKYNAKGITAITNAVGDLYENTLKATPKGPYNAICLASAQDPIADVPGVPNFGKKFGIQKGGYLVKVCARIEEIHAGLTKPILYGAEGLNNIEEHTLAILLHPVFYSFSSKQAELPEVGNVIKVDFLGDRADKSYGEYLGIVDSTIRGCKVNFINLRDLMGDAPEGSLGETQEEYDEQISQELGDSAQTFEGSGLSTDTPTWEETY